jgi:4-hydroxy-2-oxoheptanedioate aldolase
MGHGSDWKAAPVMAAIEKALRAIDGASTCAGVLALTPDDEDRFGAWGARYFATVTTSIISQAFRQAATQGRQPGADRCLSY